MMGETRDTRPAEDAQQTLGQKQDCAVMALAGGAVIGVAGMLSVSSVASGAMQMPAIFGCCALTMLLMLALFWVLDRSGAGRKASSIKNKKIWVAVFCVVFLSVFAAVAGLHVFAGQYMTVRGNSWYTAFCAAALVALCVAVFLAKHLRGAAAKALLMLAFAAACTVEFLYTYTPNILNQEFYVQHHYTAVIQSIYNVAFNEPYTLASSGVYGHYAILLWPLVKIFGHAPQTITWFLVAGNLIVLTMFLLTVFKLTRNDVLRMLALAAVCNAKVCQALYTAVFPIRVLWPHLILVYIIYREEILRLVKKPGTYMALGYGICALAITWSTDSGMVATVAYALSFWLRRWQAGRPMFSRDALRLYLLTGLGCAGACLGMVALINLYNLLCGGPLILKDCFFPIVDGEGYVGALATDIQASSYNCIIPPLCFMCALVIGGAFSSPVLGIGTVDRMPLAFCGLMGLGQSYYYFNRSVAGWSAVMGYLIMCLTALSEIGLSMKKPASLHQAIKYAVGLGSIFYLCVFALNGGEGALQLSRAKLGTDINSMDSMEYVSAAVAESLPKDTYAFGYCTQDVYAYLGWDPGYHQRDVSDFYGAGAETARDEINEHSAILLSLIDAGALKREDKYLLKMVLPEDDPQFYYYERIGDCEDVSVPVDEQNLVLTDMGGYQIVARLFPLKENTLYRVDLSLKEGTNYSTADGLAVDFYLGDYYNEPGAKVRRFVREGQYDYTLYMDSGETGGELLYGQVRVYVQDLTSVIELDSLRVTELRLADE